MEHWWKDHDRGKRNYWERYETCLCATLSTTNPECIRAHLDYEIKSDNSNIHFGINIIMFLIKGPTDV